MPALACQFRIDPFQYTAARFVTDPLLLTQLEYTTLKAKQEIGFDFVIQLHVGAGSLKQQHAASTYCAFIRTQAHGVNKTL